MKNQKNGESGILFGVPFGEISTPETYERYDRDIHWPVDGFSHAISTYIGGLNEKNVIGQFESQFQSDIADLDDTDELVFDENELM